MFESELLIMNCILISVMSSVPVPVSIWLLNLEKRQGG